MKKKNPQKFKLRKFGILTLKLAYLPIHLLCLLATGLGSTVVPLWCEMKAKCLCQTECECQRQAPCLGHWPITSQQLDTGIVRKALSPFLWEVRSGLVVKEHLVSK